MNNQEKIAIDPQIKKEINEEGFEYGGRDDEEAAVLIGKKEDMPQMLERLEKEGMAEDLGSYIKMHKEIALPNTEITEEIKEKVFEQKGLIWQRNLGNNKDFNAYNNTEYKYIDKDGNIANVRIDPEKINDFKEEAGNVFIRESNKRKDGYYKNSFNGKVIDLINLKYLINGELKKMGFNIIDDTKDYTEEYRLNSELLQKINQAISDHQYKIKQSLENKEKEEFDF